MLRALAATVPTVALIIGVMPTAPAQAAPPAHAEKITVQSSCYGPDLGPVPGRIRFTTRPAPNGTYARARVTGVKGTWRGGIVTDQDSDVNLNTPRRPKAGGFGQYVLSPVKRPEDVFAIYRQARRAECLASVVGLGRANLAAMGGPVGVLVRRGERPVLKVFPMYGTERARFRVTVRVTTPKGKQRKTVTRRVDPQIAGLIKIPGLRHLRSFTRIQVTSTKLGSGATSRLTVLRSPVG
ncbi:hypothetical protein [Nocardioides insulae]|uniref:hypothetical protein n=1 Tax=Nocardioides insulae TaxID=394734 RepID=UPI00048A65D1|nr:hypothetical protein [Nocardioides insulae]